MVLAAIVLTVVEVVFIFVESLSFMLIGCSVFLTDLGTDWILPLFLALGDLVFDF